MRMPETKRQLQPVRVLIADDNPGARAGLKALLKTLPVGPAGLEILEAADGQQAVSLAENRLPDLVLLDIQMPMMDGITALRQIKRRRPVTRVVVLTMFADRRREALEAGADLFLLKGAPPDRLLAAIQATLSL